MSTSATKKAATSSSIAEDIYYKTELCRSFASGKCPYRLQCRFAHGDTELRPTILPHNYKTKSCVNFEKNGKCSYGSRCHFVHSHEEMTLTEGEVNCEKEEGSSRRFDQEKFDASQSPLLSDAPSESTEESGRKPRKNRALSSPDVKTKPVIVVGPSAAARSSTPGSSVRYLNAVLHNDHSDEYQPGQVDEHTDHIYRPSRVISAPIASASNIVPIITSSASSSKTNSPSTKAQRHSVSFCPMEPAQIEIAMLAEALSQAAAAIENEYARPPLTQPLTSRRLATLAPQPSSELYPSSAPSFMRRLAPQHHQLQQQQAPTYLDRSTPMAPHATPFMGGSSRLGGLLSSESSQLDDQSGFQLLPPTNFFNSNLNRALTQWSLANLGFLDQGNSFAYNAVNFL